MHKLLFKPRLFFLHLLKSFSFLFYQKSSDFYENVFDKQKQKQIFNANNINLKTLTHFPYFLIAFFFIYHEESLKKFCLENFYNVFILFLILQYKSQNQLDICIINFYSKVSEIKNILALQSIMSQNQILQDILKVAVVFEQLGFQSAKQNILPLVLEKLEPNKGTAMRDSIIQGCTLMLQLYQFISTTQLRNVYNFVMIVLTDGADNESKSTLEETLAILNIIGDKIPVQMLKIIFVGVGVDSQTQKTLNMLAKAGGQNCQYYNINSSDISNIFNKITLRLGLEERRVLFAGMNNNGDTFVGQSTQIRPKIELMEHNYAVLFNLDFSGSMAGDKWKRLCAGTRDFLNALGPSDFGAGMVFNDKSVLLPLNMKPQTVTKTPPSQPQRQLAPMPKNYSSSSSSNKSCCQLY